MRDENHTAAWILRWAMVGGLALIVLIAPATLSSEASAQQETATSTTQEEAPSTTAAGTSAPVADTEAPDEISNDEDILIAGSTEPKNVVVRQEVDGNREGVTEQGWFVAGLAAIATLGATGVGYATGARDRTSQGRREAHQVRLEAVREALSLTKSFGDAAFNYLALKQIGIDTTVIEQVQDSRNAIAEFVSRSLGMGAACRRLGEPVAGCGQSLSGAGRALLNDSTEGQLDGFENLLNALLDALAKKELEVIQDIADSEKIAPQPTE